MGWGEMDLVRCGFYCLVSVFWICRIGGLAASPSPDISPYPSKPMIMGAPYSERSASIFSPSPLTIPIGSVPNTPSILPKSPEAFTPAIQAAAPFIPSSPPAPSAEEHKFPGSVTPSHNSDHDISPSTVDPPSTQVGSGSPIGETQGKPSHGSQSTLPYAAAPSPRILPLTPPDVPLHVPRISPQMIPLPGPMISPVAAPLTGNSSHLSPTNNSQFNGSSPLVTPLPHDSNITHAPSASQPAPAISVPGHRNGKIGGTPTPAPFSLPPSLHPSAPMHQLLPFPRNKGKPNPPIYVGGPVISPSPVDYPPIEVPADGRSHGAPSPNVEGPEVNPAPLQPPMPTSNNAERPSVPSPHVEGPIFNQAPSHPPIEAPTKPYFPPDQAPISFPSGEKSSTPVPSPAAPKMHNGSPTYYPAPSPQYVRRTTPSPLPQPIRSLPPPPPNLSKRN